MPGERADQLVQRDQQTTTLDAHSRHGTDRDTATRRRTSLLFAEFARRYFAR